MSDQEAIAAIRIVGAVARADGKVTDKEREAFAQAVGEFSSTLPDGSTVEQLLTEETDVDAQLALVTSPVMRKAVFNASMAMALVDGASTEENKLLARIRTAFAVEGGQASILDRVLRDEERIEGATPQLDAATRAERVKVLITKRTLWASVFGALPIPLVSDVGVLLQIDSLIGGIAVAWGHPLTRKERFARFGAVLSIAVAQGAVHSLLKLIPGWGSTAGAIGGAITAFAATNAIGHAVNYHFEQEGKVTSAELKDFFLKKKATAKTEYESKKDEIDRFRSQHADEIGALTAKLEKKEITEDEFNKRVADLTNG